MFPELSELELTPFASEYVTLYETGPDAVTVGEGPLMVTAGAVLSTVNVAPIAGADVMTLPAKSVPVLSDTVAVPLPEPTVCVYLYCVLVTFVMAVAARVLAPLIAIRTTGESAISSLNVAGIRRDGPLFPRPVGE